MAALSLKLVGVVGFLRLYRTCWNGSAPFVHCLISGVTTLGSCTGTDDSEGVMDGDANVGRLSTLCNASAIFKSAFLVASPASKATVVDEAGVVSIDIISNAACFKNHLSSVLEKELL